MYESGVVTALESILTHTQPHRHTHTHTYRKHSHTHTDEHAHRCMSTHTLFTIVSRERRHCVVCVCVCVCVGVCVHVWKRKPIAVTIACEDQTKLSSPGSATQHIALSSPHITPSISAAAPQ